MVLTTAQYQQMMSNAALAQDRLLAEVGLDVAEGLRLVEASMEMDPEDRVTMQVPSLRSEPLPLEQGPLPTEP